MRALVTGICGFVGRHLAQHLVESGDDVLGSYFGVRPTGLSCELTELDITDSESFAQVITRSKPDVVYHLAGISFVPEAEDDFKTTLLANVLGTNNLFRICHLIQRNIKIVAISSAEVYGKVSAAALPIKEDAPIAPANNYSLSKAMAELVAIRYGAQGQVPYVIARPFNHIGPGQNERFVAASFALQLARIAKGQAAPTIYVGNLRAKRDFSDVRDIVRGYRLAAIKGSGIYNFGSGRSIVVHELLEMLINISGLEVEILEDPVRMRPSDVPEIYGSYAKAQNELGWEPRLSVADTLRDIYHYWLERI